MWCAAAAKRNRHRVPLAISLLLASFVFTSSGSENARRTRGFAAASVLREGGENSSSGRPAFVWRGGGVDIAVGDLWAGTRRRQLPSESATWTEKKKFLQYPAAAAGNSTSQPVADCSLLHWTTGVFLFPCGFLVSPYQFSEQNDCHPSTLRVGRADENSPPVALNTISNWGLDSGCTSDIFAAFAIYYKRGKCGGSWTRVGPIGHPNGCVMGHANFRLQR